MAKIEYWNREAGRLETENVYGAEWLERVYGSPAKTKSLGALLANKWLSKAYGLYKGSALSAAAIPIFIREYAIPMHEYEDKEYDSFNDFFIRRFRAGQRPFCTKPEEFSAFAEARYFAFSAIEESAKIPVKGIAMTTQGLLGKASYAQSFAGGPVFLARLCPVDYHRFHYPDTGKLIESYTIPGALHSVNPLALQAVGNVLHTNERVVSILQTENFGLLAYIEVGALCVGRIVQSHSSSSFWRGDEKGYFLFGGSTVIVLAQPDKLKPDADLLQKSQAGVETLVKLGTRIASASV